MSQDIADMPGIEAAMERFSAMTGTGTETVPQPAGETPTLRDTPASSANTSQADAQPAAGRQSGSGSATGQSALPNNVEAQNSVTNPTSSSAKATEDGARAATEPIQTATGAAGNDKSSSSAKATEDRRDDKGRFTANDATKNDSQSGLTSAATQDGKGGAGASRYAKAQERLEKTWEAVNKRKTDLDAQAQAHEQQRQTLERDKAQFEAVRRQAEQPQATPEQAVQAAQARRRDADALRMQAKRAEDAGRLDEAQRLNKQADKAESLADELGSYAEELRKNPPVSMQQRQQQFEQARKQWTVEACNAFPDLGKNGSRLQQVVAQHLNALSKQDPQLLVHPSLIYHIARLADAQIKVTDLETVAARVPALEKDAESLRARIKELEAETTPAGNGGVSRLGGEPRDDYASLRREAEATGPMFR